MPISIHDIANALEWSRGQDEETANSGDLSAWKLASILREQHVRSANYHERQASACEELMDQIEKRLTYTPSFTPKESKP